MRFSPPGMCTARGGLPRGKASVASKSATAYGCQVQPYREKILEAAGWSGRLLLDLVLPPQCPTCDVVVDMAGRFCPACFRRADFIVDPCCRRCGVGFSSIGEAGLARTCADCLDKSPGWRHARAAFSYDDFSRQLILPLKYADRTENAGFL